MTKTQFESWYAEECGRYERLARYILGEVDNALKMRRVDVAKTEFRVKDIKSATIKAQATVIGSKGKTVNKYNDPKNEITDYAGVRVVVFLTSDIELIKEIIERMFEPDMSNCIDKSSDLGENKVGYLSVHYVVKLPSAVVDKPEYADLQDLKCEIQVRTVLQHAWAQIFHDRQYKFNSNVILPQELLRTTNLIAGNLELSDRLVSDVVGEYDILLGNLDSASFNKLLQMPMNKETLVLYLKQKLNLSSGLRYFNSKKTLGNLERCGVKRIAHLDNKIKRDFISNYNRQDTPMTIDRLVDCVLIVNNHKIFFEKCFEKTTKHISREAYVFLSQLVNIDGICSVYSLDIQD